MDALLFVTGACAGGRWADWVCCGRCTSICVLCRRADGLTGYAVDVGLLYVSCVGGQMG